MLIGISAQSFLKLIKDTLNSKDGRKSIDYVLLTDEHSALPTSIDNYRAMRFLIPHALGSLVGRVVNAEVKPVGNTQKGMRKSLPENEPQKLSSLCEA